eukprot:6212717-Pleurochrysis_carterae.AAC.3
MESNFQATNPSFYLVHTTLHAQHPERAGVGMGKQKCSKWGCGKETNQQIKRARASRWRATATVVPSVRRTRAV